MQRIVHGLPTAHTSSSSKPLSCCRVDPQLGGAQWGHPWVGQNPDLDLLLLPSCCPWVGLGDLHSCEAGHGHGTLEKPARDRPSGVPQGSTALEIQWQISFKHSGPEAQRPTRPTPPWARSSKDFVALLLHGPGVLKTWEHGPLSTSQQTSLQGGQAVSV